MNGVRRVREYIEIIKFVFRAKKLGVLGINHDMLRNVSCSYVTCCHLVGKDFYVESKAFGMSGVYTCVGVDVSMSLDFTGESINERLIFRGKGEDSDTHMVSRGMCIIKELSDLD